MASNGDDERAAAVAVVNQAAAETLPSAQVGAGLALGPDASPRCVNRRLVVGVVVDGVDEPVAYVPSSSVPACLRTAETTEQLLLHRDHLDEDQVGQRVADASGTRQFSVRRVDNYGDYVSLLRLIQTSLGALTAVIVGIAGAGLVILTWQASRARVRDLAVWRAVGMNRQGVAVLVVAESVLVAILGGVTASVCLYPLTLAVRLDVWRLLRAAE